MQHQQPLFPLPGSCLVGGTLRGPDYLRRIRAREKQLEQAIDGKPKAKKSEQWQQVPENQLRLQFDGG